MRHVDRVCAGALFLLAIVECWLVPRDYTGRIWIFGTGLALLFVAMLNLLRIRNGYSVRGLKMFCIGANVVMTVFVAALMASIGGAKTVGNPQVIVIFGLLLDSARASEASWFASLPEHFREFPPGWEWVANRIPLTAYSRCQKEEPTDAQRV